MPTRNIAPVADGEGSIGTPEKKWGGGHFKNITVYENISDGSSSVPISTILSGATAHAERHEAGGPDEIDVRGLRGGWMAADVEANRPPAGVKDRYFLATDTLRLYYDNGESWVLVTLPPAVHGNEQHSPSMAFADLTNVTDATLWNRVQPFSTRTYYVNAVNGNDNNDGSQSAPFKTLKKAMEAAGPGKYVTIYLTPQQTYEVTNHIRVYSSFFDIYSSNLNQPNPTILFKSYVSGGCNRNYRIESYHCSFRFVKVNLTVEAGTSGYPYAPDTVGIAAFGLTNVLCYGATLTINTPTGLMSCRDNAFLSVYVYGCTINDNNGALLHALAGVGAVVNVYENTILNGRWANGVQYGSSGYVKNVLHFNINL